MSRKVTFDRAPPPGTINFGVGQPSTDLLPIDLFRSSTADFLDNAQPDDLNYGERQGDPGFRQSLARFISREYRAETGPEALFLTSGNSQALDLLCTLFTRPGDTVLIEEPSYFLAFRIFEDHGLKLVSVPVDEHGMDPNALQSVLAKTRPVLLYTIPSFHNPHSHTMNFERRRNLARLSLEHDFIIAADEVYQMLWYDQPPPAAMATLIGDGNIVSMGSFSKILAPGSRLGWIQTSPGLMEKLLDSGMVNSGGALNQFTSLVVRAALEAGRLDEFLKQLRVNYALRMEAMHASLLEHFSGRARWTRPGGGYFFWLEFEEGIDTTELKEQAPSYKTGFQPGTNSSARGELKNAMRLSFARYREHEIRQGIKRLANLFAENT